MISEYCGLNPEPLQHPSPSLLFFIFIFLWGCGLILIDQFEFQRPISSCLACLPGSWLMLVHCQAILKESEAHMVKQGQARVPGRFWMDLQQLKMRTEAETSSIA